MFWWLCNEVIVVYYLDLGLGSLRFLSKEDNSGPAMRRVHMFWRTIWSLGIVSGAHWENCAELKRFGIFRRIGRNALPSPPPPPPLPLAPRHHWHRPQNFSAPLPKETWQLLTQFLLFEGKNLMKRLFLVWFLHAKNLMLGEGSLRKVWRNN